jgi:hypothetical protein
VVAGGGSGEGGAAAYAGLLRGADYGLVYACKGMSSLHAVGWRVLLLFTS